MDLPTSVEKQTECLARAIFFEARGENFTGQKYVGYVIKNRVLSDLYPDGFCMVINQPSQFSFRFNRRIYMSDEESRAAARAAARQVIHSNKSPLPPNVLHFTNKHVTPSWNKKYIKPFMTYGNHMFYKKVK